MLRYLKIFFKVTQLVLILGACSSDDYGKISPKELAVNESSPTWEDDIEPLMQLKCATCHTVFKGRFVPTNTPATNEDLDKISYKENFRTLSNSIFIRVFESADNPMPPHFATPLSTSEKSALRTYLQSIGVDVCPSTTSLSYTDMQKVVNTNCATSGCHTSGTSRADLSSLSNIKTYRSQALAKIRLGATASGVMPPSYASSASSFYGSTDRTKMIEWLCAGADVK